MGILRIKTTFTSSEEKFGCPFSLLSVIRKVIYFSDIDEKCFEVGPFTRAVIPIQKELQFRSIHLKTSSKNGSFP